MAGLPSQFTTSNLVQPLHSNGGHGSLARERPLLGSQALKPGARSLEWRADANKAARRAAQAPSGQQTCAWKCGPAKLFNSLLKPRYLIKAAATTAQPCPPITGQPRGRLGQGCRNVPPPVSGVKWTQPKCPGVKTTVTDSNWQLPG